jgi:hypothetical protein
MVTEKEILQLQYDKHQTQFAIDGSLIINQKVIDEQTPLTALINKNNYWICPFCLIESNNFTIENKGLIICQNCLIGMRLKTLLFIKDCSNIDYAKWVFEYRLSGFFAKLKSGNNSFEKWNKKMQDLGISYEFWDKYNSLKCEYIDDENRDKLNITHQETLRFIEVLINKINEGLTKEQIINELNDVDVSIEAIEYCYNEALLKIKHKDV